MQDDPNAKAIRGLAIAVWALAAAVLISAIAPIVWTYFAYPQHLVAGGETSFSLGDTPTEVMAELKAQLADDGFQDWPIEKQIAQASAILLTKHTIEDGKLLGTVAEVLMQRPDTTLFYKAGDRYRHSDLAVLPDTIYGDGSLVFFTGSPARMRYSVTYSDGRCSALGDMPISHIRELIAKDMGS